MTAPRRVKAASSPRLVGVIFSEQDLQHALGLRKPPDLFELRLDGLVVAIDKMQAAMPKLRSPLIITARAPREGGANHLSLARRRELLVRFLPDARYVDVELSCAKALSAVLKQARAQKVSVILSLHDLAGTPTLRTFLSAAHRAHSLGADIFKIASRTDQPEQVDRLVEFIQLKSSPLPTSAMGLGRLGRASRARLAQSGSVLNYAYLGRPTIEGQWSLAQLRAALKTR
jgi:3-dehydroquinate dehydratase I